MFLMLEDLFLWKELGRWLGVGGKSISDLSRLSVEAMLLEMRECSLVVWCSLCLGSHGGLVGTLWSSL